MSLTFDREQISGELISATSEVLETMFFASVDEEWSAEEAASQRDLDRRRLLAEISFSGGCDGRLLISLEQDVAEGLAASFFGQSDALSGNQESLSTMAELANMICGNLLSRLEKSAIFHLNSPSVGQEISPQDFTAEYEPGATIEKYFSVDNGLLHLAFALSAR